ncbi:MAG: DNA/RNA non-specific endonuclease [Bacteroidales bacterium]|nr:DNA/RNA non-specific endonuclease [Bacteroidales bacterium]
MKLKKIFPILFALVATATACDKPVVAELNLFNTSVSVAAEGGKADVYFKTNQNWSIHSDSDWVTTLPISGIASDNQKVTLTVAANPTTSERTATVTVTAGDKSGQISVKQAAREETPRMTISEFRDKKVDGTTWYELTGEIAAIENEEYGNFIIFDETGYVYVYGLCATQRPMGGNDESFSTLGLKPGDKVTMMTLRSEYNGTIEAGGQTPAYFLGKEEGTYRLGRKVASTKAGWMELPATSADDKQDLLIHYFPDGQRSYSAYYDYGNFVSSWVAYPLCAGNIGSGGRTDKFCLDPLLPRSQQAYLPGTYREGNAGKFDRGHQIPSADRLDWRVNIETFFATNMTPQVNELNAEAWAVLESKVRDWAKKSDTLYVVTGCVTQGSDKYALDSDNKQITVPVGYYKALLRLSKGEYSANAFWFENAPDKSTSIPKTKAMSVDELEKKVGVDFFVNLDADTQKTVESADPTQTTWWWSN